MWSFLKSLFRRKPPPRRAVDSLDAFILEDIKGLGGSLKSLGISMREATAEEAAAIARGEDPDA